MQVIDQFDPRIPSWPKDSKPLRIIACHDTEGGTGRAGAEGTISFLIDTAAARQASYHEIWAWEGGELTVYRIVRANRAAGSIGPQTPAQGGHYTPDAHVSGILGDDTYDPNQCVYAVSIAGTRGYVDVLAASPAFVAAAKQRLLWIGSALKISKLAEHFRFQNDRTDWGPKLTAALGGLNLQPLYGLVGWPDYARRTQADAAGYAYRILVNAGAAPRTAAADKWGVAGWPGYARDTYEHAAAYALRIFLNNPTYAP